MRAATISDGEIAVQEHPAGGVDEQHLAGAEAPTLGAPAAATSQDFATMAYGDPWDFANREDVITSDGPLLNASSAAVRDGMLKFTLSKTGHVSLVWPGYQGALFAVFSFCGIPVRIFWGALAERVGKGEHLGRVDNHDRQDGGAKACRHHRLIAAGRLHDDQAGA